MSEELKVCPFCGGKPSLSTKDADWCFVTCNNEECSARLSSTMEETKAAAIAAWNTRAETRPTHGNARVEALVRVKELAEIIYRENDNVETEDEKFYKVSPVMMGKLGDALHKVDICQTRPTHSDKGECETCAGKGYIPSKNPRWQDGLYDPCPDCNPKCVCGETGSRNCPVHQNQPSDKLEGDPLRYPLRYPMGQLRTYKEGGGIMSYLASHIIHLYTHIDRLNAEFVKERGK